jgi:hypothetical protein
LVAELNARGQRLPDERRVVGASLVLQPFADDEAGRRQAMAAQASSSAAVVACA